MGHHHGRHDDDDDDDDDASSSSKSAAAGAKRSKALRGAAGRLGAPGGLRSWTLTAILAGGRGSAQGGPPTMWRCRNTQARVGGLSCCSFWASPELLVLRSASGWSGPVAVKPVGS
eukprot:2811292-Prymnesium_polylepis.1